jgi:hypothetical protein
MFSERDVAYLQMFWSWLTRRFRMLRKLFNSGNGILGSEDPRVPAATNAPTFMEPEDAQDERQGRVAGGESLLANAAFHEIYQKASTKLPRTQWGIQKLREMAESPHLAGMNAEAKRSAILMALDAAGAKIEEILQDAVLRQRALNEYEEKEETRLREYEGVKTEHSRGIQAELNRLTAQNMARIQTNVDEIARQQDNFRAWQKRKTDESESIASAAALLIPQGASANGSSTLATVLERASAAYR